MKMWPAADRTDPAVQAKLARADHTGKRRFHANERLFPGGGPFPAHRDGQQALAIRKEKAGMGRTHPGFHCTPAGTAASSAVVS